MKRVLVATILGLAASVASSFGQASYFFDTYASAGSEPSGIVTWTTDASLAPVGQAGQTVGSGLFVADLLWQVGTLTGDTGLAVPTSVDNPGYIRGGSVDFDPSYVAYTPITFTILAWEGASYASATARGSITWTDPGAATGAGAVNFAGASFPQGAIYVANVAVVPEPATLALAGLGLAGLLIARKRS